MSPGRPTVLLVEDDEIDRLLFRSRLAVGYDLVEAESGRRALEICRASPPECVLLDHRLPDIDGLDLIADLIAVDPAPAVVLLTGQGNEEIAVEAMKLGAQDYLVKKSASPTALTRAIDNAIEKLSLRRDLEDRRRELEDFVHMAAHDLRSPLSSFKGLCDDLRDELKGHLTREIEENLAYLTASAKKMGRLLDDLLTYAQSGRSAIPREPTQLEDALEAALGALQEDIDHLGAKVVQAGPLPTVDGVPSALAQAFQNLIQNALHYRSEAPPEITVSARDLGGHWCITVRDNGAGIDPALHAEVVRPFKRADPSGRPGSGLGLAICSRVAAQHGGKLWIQSPQGGGTAVCFTLEA